MKTDLKNGQRNKQLLRNTNRNLRSITKLSFGILFAMIAINLATTARSQSYTETVGGPNSFENAYANVRGWRVVSGQINGRFSYCVAEKSDRGSLLRLGYDNQQWQLSFPFRSNTNWSGNLKIDGDTRNASGSVSGNWTVVWLSLDELERVRNGTAISLDIGRASSDEYQLFGTAAVILKIEECLRNQGNQPAPRVVQNNPRPQPIQPRRNNQLPATQNREQFYASVRGWQVDAVFGKQGFEYCGATVAERGQYMRIAHGLGKWGIGLQTSATGNFYGQLIVTYKDGRNFQAGTVSYANDGDGWAAAQLDWQFIGHLKSGSIVGIDIGQGAIFEFSLSGSTAAMLKVEECVRNQGRKPIRQTVQPNYRPNNIPPTNNNNRQGYNIPLKQVLSGIWVWTDRQKNAKQNAIVSTLEMTGYDTAKYCFGFLCWDVRLTRNPDNTISFSHDGVAMFIFSEVGHNAISGKFWEDFSSPGSVDATVQMR